MTTRRSHFLVLSGIILGVASLTALLPAPASAQSGLAEGQAMLEQANFEAAVRAFDGAEAATSGLSREDLVALYADRASAHLALGHTGPMEADLRRLASLDPAHRFGPATRPEIAEAFERLSADSDAVLSVEATVSEGVGGVRVEAAAHNDPEGVARVVRVRARVADGEWVSRDGGSVSLPVTTGATVEYVVEAIGPGGAVIASEGTEPSPATHVATGAASDGPSSDDPLDEDGGSNVGLIVGLTVGVALVAVAIAIIVVAASGGDGETSNPSPPMIYP